MLGQNRKVRQRYPMEAGIVSLQNGRKQSGQIGDRTKLTLIQSLSNDLELLFKFRGFYRCPLLRFKGLALTLMKVGGGFVNVAIALAAKLVCV